MKIAIIEIAQFGHYTYVESIADIYSSIPENEVVIFTDEKGAKQFPLLNAKNISIVKKDAEMSYLDFLSTIKSFEKVIFVTLEPNYKSAFQLAKAFVNVQFNCPIYFVIHNIDFWFQQSLTDKIRNSMYQLKSFNDFVYRLKVYFYYAFINKKIIQKVKKSGGSFIVISEVVANELSKHIDKKSIKTIPFSVFNNRLKDKSGENTSIRICIPGYVSAVRRDYFSIFKMLESFTDVLKYHVEIDFLGGIASQEGGDKIVEKAKELIALDYKIHIYNKPLVNIEEFDLNLSKADLVLGNLHLNQGVNSSYGKTKDSGLIFTMIKAAKPGLMPKGYNFDAALKTSILQFENYEEVQKMLIHLRENPSELMDLKLKARENSLKYTPLSIYNKIEGTNSF